MKKFKSFILALSFSLSVVSAGWAVNFEKIPSTHHHAEIWHMRTKTIPSVSMQISFPIGYAHDPEGKEGLSNLMASTMDEGAGDLSSDAFREALADNQISLYYTTSANRFVLHLNFLKYDFDTALYLARLSLTKPRFDQDAVDLIKNQVIASIKNSSKSPESIKSNLAKYFYYNTHPFSKPQNGYLESVSKLSLRDLHQFHQHLSRKNAFISAVGDISKQELMHFSERLFTDIPTTTLKDTDIQEYSPIDIEKKFSTFLDIPQSHIVMQTSGIKRNSADFLAAYLGIHVLGGGGFGSELVSEIREKHGLTYSISASLDSSAQDSRMIIQFATDNKNVKKSIEKTKDILATIADKGITQSQFEKAKTNLKGQYVLAFETNNDISNLAQGLYANHLPYTYPHDRQALFDAIKIEDVNRVLKKILKQPLTIIVVGGNKKLEDFQDYPLSKVKF